MNAKLSREAALEFSYNLVEDWLDEILWRSLTISEQQEIVLEFAKLYLLTARELQQQDLSVAWAEPIEFYIQPHY